MEPVLIIGGGIAGLTAALALARTGRASIVLERAPDFSEIGAGLQVSPNAAAVLCALGLGEALDKAAHRPDAILMRSGPTGRLLKRLPVKSYCQARFGHPYRVVHRADLLRLLADAADRAPEIRLLAGAEARDMDLSPHSVAVRTADGRRFRGPALIGADGVWSTVRAKCLDLPPAVPSGRTAWRAIVAASALAEENRGNVGLWMGPGAHLVHYPLRDGTMVNLVAIVEDGFAERTWDAEADSAALARAFRGWCSDARALIGATADWRRWPLARLRPEPHAGAGPVVLIGDAWHATLPFMAQGAAMAIEDAAVLAHCLATGDDPLSAFDAFQRQRLARTARLVALAGRNGRLYHMRGAPAYARDKVLSLLPPERLLELLDWIYGWKPPGLT